MTMHVGATLVLLATLLGPPVPAPRPAPVTVPRTADASPVVAIAKGSWRSAPLLGLGARGIAYGAEPGEPESKPGLRFLQEFINLTLKVLGIIGVFAIVLATVRLWLHDRATAKQREDLRICPGCYRVVRRREASRCPYCRAELTPGTHVEAPRPRLETGRYQPMREEPVRSAEGKRPAREEPIRVARREERAPEAPIRGEPVHPGVAPTERVREEPIREGPDAEGPEVWEREESEREERIRQEDEREERVQRRKIFVYTFLTALTVGYLLAAILFVLLRL